MAIDLIGETAAVCMDMFGEDATYDVATPCRVIIDDETVILRGEESTSARTETTLSFLLSEVAPERGKLVATAAKTYKLGKQIANDGALAQHLVER